MAFIDAHRDRFGVEPMCRVLTEHGVAIAPSTSYAAKTRAPSARSVADAALLPDIRRVHGEVGRGLYGARKVCHQLTDVFSRRIVGWRTAASMPTALPLDALEMALWTRARADEVVDGIVRHSDAGSQHTSIRYADRLLDAGAVASIGTVGDSYDNALAESTIGLYKTECTRREGPWRNVEDLELAALS